MSARWYLAPQHDRPDHARKLMALIRMSRPTVLLAGVLAYALGLTMAFSANGGLDWGPALAGLAVTLLAILMAHFADEYADVDTDRLTRRTWFSGGSGVLPQGELEPSTALQAARICLGLSLLATALLFATSVLPAACVVLALLGIVGGWVYSMAPIALERRGWGEIDNAALGGFVMPLMAYASQTGRVSLEAVLVLGPIFGLVLLNLLGTHWPDRAADAQVGRRSLPVVLGSRARQAHHALVVAIYLGVLWLAWRGMPREVALGVLLSLPVAMWAAFVYGRQESPMPSSLTMVVGMIGAGAGWIVAGSV